MDVFDITCLALALLGIGAATWFYYHLWKWARDCQQAVLAIAYKRKVVMTPTLVELLLWSRKVPDEQNGQTFYKAPNVTVAIIKRDKRNWQTRRRLRKNQQPAQAESKLGTWAMRQDKSTVPSQGN